MLAGRQMKKTKTSVARNTLLPVYNEAFVFDVPIDRLSDVSLLVRVLDTYHGDGRRPQTRTIGKTIVGPDAQTSIGLHHWNCMMTTPRKPIAQWHPLVKSWLTIKNIIRKFTSNASVTKCSFQSQYLWFFCYLGKLDANEVKCYLNTIW